MIISASYKTDIPAFYGEWFSRRFSAGFCRVVNPINRRPFSVSLRRQDVDGFVFWTKNIGPFVPQLADVAARGDPFIVQFTVTGYPRELESAVIDPTQSVAQFRELAETYGPRAVVWRYDPVLITSLTPIGFHVENFARLARELRGATDEVVVSYAQIYKKTLANTNRAANKHGFDWSDPTAEQKLELTGQFAEVAKSNRMTLSICSQPEFLTAGSREARCVDAIRLADIAGAPINSRKKGNRATCACFESRDIGEYDTCPHGCVYCYAVRSRELARDRFKDHDPAGEFLHPVRLPQNPQIELF